MAKTLINKILRVIAHQIEYDHGKLKWYKLKKINLEFNTWINNGMHCNDLETWTVKRLYERMKRIYDDWSTILERREKWRKKNETKKSL